MKDFEISKREISLVVNDTWVINSPADLLVNWSHNGDLLNNNSASDYYVENIVTSTGLRYSINSNVNLERKKYQYATTGTYDSNFTLNEFDVSWQAWYLNTASTALDTTVASNELTQNYTLRATINLTVRFKLIEYNIVDNVYTYDGTAKSFGPNVVVTSPSPSTCTIMFGTVKGTYDLTDNPQTLPGSYLAYVQISAPNYEIAEDKTILTIDHFRREDVGLDVSSINKTYDALVYDGTVASGGVPTVTWKNPSLVQFGETIPAQSSWTISYYKATGSDAKGWKKASEPKSEVVDAGEYLIEIVIPAGVYYGETTLLEHFKISRRQVTVSGTAADYIYNGSTWQYNIYNNPDGLTITGLVNDGTNVHKFVSGTLFSSSVNSGIYQKNSETGKYIDFYPGYEIVDQNMDEVTVNYEYIIDVVLNIKKANMTFVWNIPDLTGGSFPYGYTYDQTKHYPSITIVAPTQAVIDASAAKILYSDDGIYYDEHEKDFTFVSNYRVHAKLTDVANYNDLDTYEDFSIIMAKNTLSVQDLSKIYDGSTVFNPKVVTLEGSEIAKDSWLTWLDSTGAVLSTRPSEVGSYKVRVTYPTNDNYEGVQVEQPFTISPNNFTVSFDTNKLVYNTLPQSPAPIFTSDAYPSLNINKMLVPGVDYTINYYDGNDLLLTTPIAEPSQVGTYSICYELISSKALNNFTIANSNKYSNYYTISPREIEIKYSGSKSYLGTSPVVIAVPDITVTNLPTGVTYTTPINTIPTQWASIDNHAVLGTYPSGLFDNYYVFDSPDNKPHLVLTASSTDDDLANYIIKLDISLTVTTSSILYAVQEYDGVYDGKAHTFKFELSMGSGINYTLYYSIDNGATWSTDKPNQTDATPNPIKILVKAVFNDSTYPDTIFGDDEPDSNKFYIKIAKADSTLEISDEAKMMDKIYDGKLVKDPVVTYNTFIDEDKRDEKLQYKYYQQDVTSTGGTTYTLINVLDILNVGKYKVEITLGETKNFKASSTKTILFEITKRDLIVRFPDVEEKTYDAVVWSALITNTGTTGASGAILEGVSGVPESGLVDGDMFTAILQSKSSNAGDYKVYPDDFTWQEAPKIFNGAGNNVTENYNIDVACWAKINEASFDGLFEAFDYIGYVDGLYHGITINWLPGKTPLVAGLANPMTLITYTKTPYDSTSYSSTPVTEMYGTTTVYFRIEAPNYVTYDGSRKIELTPKPTGAPTIDWTGKIDGSGTDRVYDGNSYNYDPLNPDIILSNSDSSDTRVPTITYYMSDGTALTSAPIDAGEYYFTVSYAADADHSQAVFGEGKEYSFKIKPYALTVVWQGDKDPTSGDPMIMYYSGSQLTPSAEAEDTRTGVPSSGTKLESAATTPTLNITVTNPSTGIAEAVGYYTAHVVIDPAAPNNVAKNYILTNDTINYKIEASGPSLSPDPFPDPYPGTGPRPTPDDYVESITIDDLNYKNTLNVPFTFGDAELYVHVTFNYNTAGPHQFWYVFDQTNGEITKIYYDNFVPFTGTINQIFTVTPPKKDDGSPDWSLKYFDSSTTADPTDADYYYVPVKVVLTDKVNTNWNTVTKDVSDLSKQIVFEQLSPNPATGDIYIVEPGYETTYMWSPTPTGVVSYTGYDGTGTIYTYEMDGTELKFSIRVMISGALVGSTVDVELVEGVDYEIVWFNNTGPTTTGRFSVKNTITSSYNFAIGNENPTDLVDKAGKFVINSPEPKYLKLKDDATMGFVQYTQDYTLETLNINDTITFDDRADALDGTGAISTQEALKDIVLGKTFQGTTIYYLVNQFANSKSRIKVKDPNTGDYLYDPTDPSKGLSSLVTADVLDVKDPLITDTSDPSNMNPLNYIRTGLIVELYGVDNPTSTDAPIDSIPIVISGDVNGDGLIDTSDAAGLKKWNVEIPSEANCRNAYYYAGYEYGYSDLLVATSFAASIMKDANEITTKLNTAFDPTTAGSGSGI